MGLIGFFPFDLQFPSGGKSYIGYIYKGEDGSVGYKRNGCEQHEALGGEVQFEAEGQSGSYKEGGQQADGNKIDGVA